MEIITAAVFAVSSAFVFFRTKGRNVAFNISFAVLMIIAAAICAAAFAGLESPVVKLIEVWGGAK